MEVPIVAYSEPQPPNFFFIFFPYQSSSSASFFHLHLNQKLRKSQFHSYFSENYKTQNFIVIIDLEKSFTKYYPVSPFQQNLVTTTL